MARKTQEELDQRIAALGGGRLTHSDTVGKRKVPNPDYDKYDSKSQETLELDIEQWKSAEGHTIQAVHMPDGSWEIIQDEPPTPKPAASTATSTTAPRVPPGSVPRTEGTPTGKKDAAGNEIYDNTQPVRAWHAPDGTVVYEALTPAERQQWEKDKNGGKTDAEVGAANEEKSAETEVANRPGWRKITTTKGGAATYKYRGPDGKVVDELPPETKEQAVTYRQNPTTKQLERVTVTTINGQPQTSYEPVKPSERTPAGSYTKVENGKTVKVSKWQMPDGSTLETTDTEEKVSTPLPAGLPQFRPDWQQPGMGAYAYAEAIHQFDREHPGALTPEQKTELLSQASANATAEATRLNTILGAQEHINSNEVSQRNADVTAQTGRRNQAVSIFGEAAKTAEGLRGYSKPGSESAGKAQIAQMVLGSALASMMGGPAIAQTQLSPALQQMRGQSLPMISPSSVPTGAQLSSGFNPVSAAVTEAARQQQMAAAAAPTAPPAVQGVPSPLGDTGAPPVPAMPPQSSMVPGQSPLAALMPGQRRTGLFDDISLASFMGGGLG